jgi:tartrate dehydratase beta subunit/fumarate hydratase class I family protein
MSNKDALQARLRFLNDSAHLIAIGSPTTSAVLGSHYDKLLAENDLDLQASKKDQDSRRREVCGACGSLMIPGWSCHVIQENIKPKEAQRAKKFSRKSTGKLEKVKVYTCLRCHRKTVQPVLARESKVLLKKPIVSKSQTIQHAASAAPASITEYASATSKSANASSKKRAKARKQGGLQAMLAKSKTELLGPSSEDFGLDLMDLMKSD